MAPELLYALLTRDASRKRWDPSKSFIAALLDFRLMLLRNVWGVSKCTGVQMHLTAILRADIIHSSITNTNGSAELPSVLPQASR